MTRCPILGSVTNGTAFAQDGSTVYPQRSHPNGGLHPLRRWCAERAHEVEGQGKSARSSRPDPAMANPNSEHRVSLPASALMTAVVATPASPKLLARKRRIALRLNLRRWPEQCQAGCRRQDTKSAAHSTVFGAGAPVATACSACWIAGVGIAMRRLSRNCSAAASRTTSTTGS